MPKIYHSRYYDYVNYQKKAIKTELFKPQHLLKNSIEGKLKPLPCGKTII